MLIVFYLIILNGLFDYSQTISFVPSSRKLRVDRFDGACRGKNVPLRIFFNLIKNENKIFYFNATVKLTEDIEGDPLMAVKVTRCLAKENLDTCEDFLAPKPSSYCKTLETNPLNVMFIDYKPEFKCPLKKGIYVANNFELDASKFLMFPLGTWYWKIFSNVTDAKTQRLLYCYEAQGHMVKTQG